MKVMLDSMIYDRIVEVPGLVDIVNALQRRGDLTILSTHIQEDELAGITDSAKAARISMIQRTRVPTTAGALYGESRYDEATYGDGSDSGISVDKARTPSKGHPRDALIAASASKHADVFVTEETRLAKRLSRLSPRCEVWSFSTFAEWVISHAVS